MMAGRPALARFLPVLVGVALLVVAHLLDPWAGHALRLPSANDRDWGRLLRILGFAPTWLAIAGLFWLESRDRSGPPERAADLARTGWAIVIAVAVGGILAELAKLLIRRERPAAEFLGRAGGALRASDHPCRRAMRQAILQGRRAAIKPRYRWRSARRQG